MDLSIILVNWNSKNYLSKCLDSIFALTRDIEFEVIVIDAGSFDGCERLLSERFPAVRFIQSSTNLGFAKANNVAFQEVTGESVLFLNPDTEVVGSAIQMLHSQLISLPGAGIVGARLLNSDGTVQTSCIQSMPTIVNKLLDSDFLRARYPRWKMWGMAALFDGRVEPSEVDAISGACLMVKAAVFREVGFFSEDYFMYEEDIDLAYKVRAAGYCRYYVPQATVVHHGGHSSGRASSTFAAVMIPEATRRFFRKTRGRAYAAAFQWGMCLNAIARLILLSASNVLASANARGTRHPSLEKWQAVLRWSLNRDQRVPKFYSGN